MRKERMMSVDEFKYTSASAAAFSDATRAA